MAKKLYSGGFRLTLKTARALAVQEFGTAKGLEPDRGTDLEGYFRMQMGNLCVSIQPDIGMSGCIVVSVGGVVLDENFRPAYSAERGQTVYQRNLRNRGRRPKRVVEQKGADGA